MCWRANEYRVGRESESGAELRLRLFWHLSSGSLFVLRGNTHVWIKFRCGNSSHTRLIQMKFEHVFELIHIHLFIEFPMHFNMHNEAAPVYRHGGAVHDNLLILSFVSADPVLATPFSFSSCAHAGRPRTERTAVTLVSGFKSVLRQPWKWQHAPQPFAHTFASFTCFNIKQSVFASRDSSVFASVLSRFFCLTLDFCYSQNRIKSKNYLNTIWGRDSWQSRGFQRWKQWTRETTQKKLNE